MHICANVDNLCVWWFSPGWAGVQARSYAGGPWRSHGEDEHLELPDLWPGRQNRRKDGKNTQLCQYNNHKLTMFTCSCLMCFCCVTGLWSVSVSTLDSFLKNSTKLTICSPVLIMSLFSLKLHFSREWTFCLCIMIVMFMCLNVPLIISDGAGYPVFWFVFQ